MKKRLTMKFAAALTVAIASCLGAASQAQVFQDFESGDATIAPDQFFLHDGSGFFGPGDDLTAEGLPDSTAFAGGGGGSVGSASTTLGLTATGGVGGSQAALLNIVNDGTVDFAFAGLQQSLEALGPITAPTSFSAFVDVLAPVGVPLSLRVESPFTTQNNGFEINFVGTGAFQTIGGVVGTDLTAIAGGTFDTTAPISQILVATQVGGSIAIGDSDVIIDNFSFAPTAGPAVPEPSSLAVLVALGSIVGFRRRRS